MSLEAKEIVKDFGGIRAVGGVSFHIPKGTITGLIGPNGSGKTTLFNLVTGFLPIDEGEIWYRGSRIDGFKPHQIVELGIIRTFQNTRIFPKLTVLENMLVPTRSNRISNLVRSPQKDGRAEKALRLLESIGLASYAHDPASSLSYGQGKLLELVLSFMVDAEMILLDEPFSGINPTLQTRINLWIEEENNRGKEFIVIEHNMDVIMNICHHIVVMHHGQKLAEGEPAVIQQNEEVLEAYLGD
jgi:neutral amino acid transport system ATP-binding protein